MQITVNRMTITAPINPTPIIINVSLLSEADVVGVSCVADDVTLGGTPVEVAAIEGEDFTRALDETTGEEDLDGTPFCAVDVDVMLEVEVTVSPAILYEEVSEGSSTFDGVAIEVEDTSSTAVEVVGPAVIELEVRSPGVLYEEATEEEETALGDGDIEVEVVGASTELDGSVITCVLNDEDTAEAEEEVMPCVDDGVTIEVEEEASANSVATEVKGSEEDEVTATVEEETRACVAVVVNTRVGDEGSSTTVEVVDLAAMEV